MKKKSKNNGYVNSFSLSSKNTGGSILSAGFPFVYKGRKARKQQGLKAWILNITMEKTI